MVPQVYLALLEVVHIVDKPFVFVVDFVVEAFEVVVHMLDFDYIVDYIVLFEFVRVLQLLPQFFLEQLQDLRFDDIVQCFYLKHLLRLLFLIQ